MEPQNIKPSIFQICDRIDNQIRTMKRQIQELSMYLKLLTQQQIDNHFRPKYNSRKAILGG